MEFKEIKENKMVNDKRRITIILPSNPDGTQKSFTKKFSTTTSFSNIIKAIQAKHNLEGGGIEYFDGDEFVDVVEEKFEDIPVECEIRFSGGKLKLSEIEIHEATKMKQIEEEAKITIKQIEESEETKRKQIEEEAKIKIKQIEESEETKRKVCELDLIRLTETTRQLSLSQSSSKLDSGYNYCGQFFTGRESLITEFTIIFDNTPLDYNGTRHQMEWLDQRVNSENHYQSLFNEFLRKFGTQYPHSLRLIIYNEASRLYYCDTHNSHDGLVKNYKPDTTVYLSNQNGQYPGPNPFKFCFFIELQIDDYDTKHAHDIIKRSEAVMKRTPQRSHAYTLWLSLEHLVVHKVKRVNDSFEHTFSTTTPLNMDFGKNILHFFLTCANPHFFGVPLLAEDIENYLSTKNYTPTDFLGGGTFSQVLNISTNNSQSFALKIYKLWDEKHQSLKNQEVFILNKLEHITVVPSIVREENNWILLDKVCKPLKAEDITQPFVDKLLFALNDVHAAGIIWGDCRPDNLGIIEGKPLLIDWNLAVERDAFTHPHNGTRCFLSQRLLRISSDELVRRFPDDDKESLLKSLIEIIRPGIRNIINKIDDPKERANVWESRYPILNQNVDEAFRNFKLGLPAN